MWAWAAGAGVVALLPLLARRLRYNPGPRLETTCRTLATRWAKVFGIQPGTAIAVVQAESDFVPGVISRKGLGDAFGAMQVRIGTARGLVSQLKSSSNASVRKALELWDNTGSSLLKPELGIMLGTYYLAELGKKYSSDFAQTIAAYHQGPGTVDAILARGGKIPDDLPPKGRAYVAMVTAARKGEPTS